MENKQGNCRPANKFIFTPEWCAGKASSLLFVGGILCGLGVVLLVIFLLNGMANGIHTLKNDNFYWAVLSALLSIIGALIALLGVSVGKADMMKEHFAIIQNRGVDQ